MGRTLDVASGGPLPVEEEAAWLPYIKWITNKDLLYSTGNYTQCIYTLN